MAADEGGVWRTISGRRIFIKNGQSLIEAMKSSGKFLESKSNKVQSHLTDEQLAQFTYSEKALIREFTSTELYLRRNEPHLRDELDAIIDKHADFQWNKGVLYRGIGLTDDELSKLSVGVKINQNGVSSWSSESSIADDFSKLTYEAGTKNPVIFVDKTDGRRTALSIMSMSGELSEYEVIYSSRSKFEIISIKVTNGVTYIDVKEVD